ncbi:MAG TPA: hypothetical protein VHB46_02885 [Burkholderiales bacterium]|nr:hypothetical protein [Burkholderiales bacterium]
MNPDPLALGLGQLRQDPQYPRIPVARHTQLVEAALADGRVLAAEVAANHGNDPEAIAVQCAIPVDRSERDAGYGSVVVHAEYVERPPRITLYVRSIAALARRSVGTQTAVDQAALERVFLAHELYHHFDCARGEHRLARRHRVDIVRIGAWRWTSGLASLAEIAAGSFARELLGLPFHPVILDFLLVQTMNHGEHSFLYPLEGCGDYGAERSEGQGNGF